MYEVLRLQALCMAPMLCQEVSACAPLSSQREQNYSVRRLRIMHMVCVISILMAISFRENVRLQVVAACAPLSSQREQNYKRSPSTELSHHVRYVNFNDYVNGNDTVSGGFGVRPALLSERNYAFAVFW